MRVASVTNGKVQVIVYKNGDYFYEDGQRVPEELRKGFKTTIFRDPSKPRRPIVQAELDAFKAGVLERARQGLLEKPEPKPAE
jgi:hypothetical protein